MSRTLIVIAALVSIIASCSDKPVVGPIPGGPYADVTFDTSESKLKALHLEVLCKQMPNPEVRMCRSKGSEGQEVTFLFYSGKLININGKTAD